MIRCLFLACALLPVAPVVAAETSGVVQAPGVAAVDPMRLAIAQRVAVRLMPNGAYRKIMGGMLDGMMKPMANNMMAMSIKDVARIGGLDEAKLASVGSGSLREIAEIIDPAFDSRMKISMEIMMAGTIDVISSMVPDFRAGLAEAYARRFTVEQLQDIERFFLSPSGQIYAEQSLLMASDPAMMQRAQAIMPKVMHAMPALAKKIEQATADLPKKRDLADLTAAEKTRLAKLMGVDPKDVK